MRDSDTAVGADLQQVTDPAAVAVWGPVPELRALAAEWAARDQRGAQTVSCLQAALYAGIAAQQEALYGPVLPGACWPAARGKHAGQPSA